MQSLMHGVDEKTKSSLPKSPSDAGTNLQERGEIMFNKVYGKVSDRVKNNIGGSSPDLMAIILEDVYGRVLSDVALLGEVETELLTIVVLVPLQVPAQVRKRETKAEGKQRVDRIHGRMARSMCGP
jgi:hypothetical protein